MRLLWEEDVGRTTQHVQSFDVPMDYHLPLILKEGEEVEQEVEEGESTRIETPGTLIYLYGQCETLLVLRETCFRRC